MSDDDKVICPNCVHEFRAIPAGVLAEIRELLAYRDSIERQLQERDIEIAALRARVAELENPWISAEERLPEMDRNLFLLLDSGRMCNGYLCLATGVYRNECEAEIQEGIAYWMPLPKPPEGQDDD